MSSFKYIILLFLFLIVNSCSKVEKVESQLKDSILTYEMWIKESIDIDSVTINGNKFKENNYSKLIADNTAFDNLSCISIPKEFNDDFEELCFNKLIKISKNQKTFRYLEINIESTKNRVTFGDFVVDQSTRYSEFFNKFPLTSMLRNRNTGYIWAGIVRVKTNDDFVFFDFYLGGGQIKKIVVQYW